MENNLIKSVDHASWTPDEHLPVDVSDNEKKEVLTRVKRSIKEVSKTYFQIIEDLYNIRSGKYYLQQGYNSFKSFVEEELDIDIRQAQYYVKVYKVLSVEMQIPGEYLQQIGITKAKALISVINEENKKHLISEIEKSPVSVFIDKYKPTMSNEDDIFFGEEKKEKLGVVRLKKEKIYNDEGYNDEDDYYEDDDNVYRESKSYEFRVSLNKDQTNVLKAALVIAKDSSHCDDNNFNLGLICTQFIASSIVDGSAGTNVVPLEILIHQINQAYGCNLEAKE